MKCFCLFVQSLSHVQLFDTPQTTARQDSLSFTINSQSLLKLTSMESVMPSNHLILCRPLLLLPSVFPSVRVFSNESALCIRWPKYWSFASGSQSIGALVSASILPMNIQGWFPLGCPCYPSTTVWKHQSFDAQPYLLSNFSHPYMTTGKTIAFTIQIFVSKAMSLIFNTLSRFVIAFLPRSKRLFISWLDSLSAVILEPKKIKSVTVSTVSPSICYHRFRTCQIGSRMIILITKDSNNVSLCICLFTERWAPYV